MSKTALITGGTRGIGFGSARGRLLAVAGPDTVPEAGWLEALASALEADPGLGLVTSRVCHLERPQLVNACGNEVHLSGFGYCRGFDEPRELHAAPAEVTAISGCAFMARREVVEELGGFDEEFFMYLEDTDLSLRARLAGHRIGCAPASVTRHPYALNLTAEKLFLLERNRQLMLLKLLRPRTLAALAPALALGELMMWAYALSHGPSCAAAKLRAQLWVLANLRRVQGRAPLRTSDAAVVSRLTAVLPGAQLLGEGRLARALGALAGACFSALAAPARLLVR